MNGELRFWLPGQPVPQARPRVTRSGHVFYPKASHDYRRQIVSMLRIANVGKPQIVDPVQVTLIFYLPKPKTNKHAYPQSRPDLDNCIKQTVDALCESRKPALGAGVIKNDGQVIILKCGKFWANSQHEPGTMVVIREIGATAIFEREELE